MIEQNSYLSTLTVTLAGGETQRHAITGSRLWVIETPATVRAAFGEREEIPLDLGFAVSLPFSSVTFRNPNAAAVTFTIIYGTGEFRDSRLNVVTTRSGSYVRFYEGPSTYTEQGRTSSFADGAASGTLSGAANTTRGRRKFLIITNEDPLSELNIIQAGQSTQAYTVAIVWPKTTIRLDTDASFIVKNFSGAAISAWNYCAVFYDAVGA